MFKLIKRFLIWIHRLTHPSPAEVPALDSDDMEESEDRNEESAEFATQNSQANLNDSIDSTVNGDEKRRSASADTDASLGADQTDDTEAMDSTDTGGSEGDNGGSDGESIEGDEQGVPLGHDKQEDASTETETNPDTSIPSGTDQTDDTKAIDSTDTEENKGDNGGSDDESIEGDEQGVPLGHDKQEDVSTETETNPDTSTPSGTDQTDDTEAIESEATGESENDNGGSDHESNEGDEQGAPLGHDKQDDTPTESEIDPDTSHSFWHRPNR